MLLLVWDSSFDSTWNSMQEKHISYIWHDVNKSSSFISHVYIIEKFFF